MQKIRKILGAVSERNGHYGHYQLFLLTAAIFMGPVGVTPPRSKIEEIRHFRSLPVYFRSFSLSFSENAAQVLHF